jgi:hypothetical protein
MVCNAEHLIKPHRKPITPHNIHRASNRLVGRTLPAPKTLSQALCQVNMTTPALLTAKTITLSTPANHTPRHINHPLQATLLNPTMRSSLPPLVEYVLWNQPGKLQILGIPALQSLRKVKILLKAPAILEYLRSKGIRELTSSTAVCKSPICILAHQLRRSNLCKGFKRIQPRDQAKFFKQGKVRTSLLHSFFHYL